MTKRKRTNKKHRRLSSWQAPVALLMLQNFTPDEVRILSAAQYEDAQRKAGMPGAEPTEQQIKLLKRWEEVGGPAVAAEALRCAPPKLIGQMVTHLLNNEPL